MKKRKKFLLELCQYVPSTADAIYAHFSSEAARAHDFLLGFALIGSCRGVASVWAIRVSI